MPIALALLLVVIKLSSASTPAPAPLVVASSRPHPSPLAHPNPSPPSPHPSPRPIPKTPPPPKPLLPPPPYHTPPPFPPSPYPSFACHMGNVCPPDLWYCQDCRALVPTPSCTQNWCFKCSSYTVQTYACQGCITNEANPGVQQNCLQCIYLVRKLPGRVWACPQYCSSLTTASNGTAACAQCLVDAPLASIWACGTCLSTYEANTLQLTECLTCIGSGLNTYACATCVALPTEGERQACFSCIRKGLDTNGCAECAAMANSTLTPACVTCLARPNINVWACTNPLAPGAAALLG